MPTSEIQATVNAIRDEQVDAEMGTQRYALLFKPGTYGSPTEPLIIQVGYYTEVAGLEPRRPTSSSTVTSTSTTVPRPGQLIALVNFWRSVSNLTINIMGETGCRASAFWAASQAAPMRRVDVTGGNLTLFDYCTAGPQFASGGFIADSRTGFVINGLSSSTSCGTAASAAGPTPCGTRYSPVSRAPRRRPSPSPPYTTWRRRRSAAKAVPVCGCRGTYNVFVPTPAPTRRAPRGSRSNGRRVDPPFGLLPGEALGSVKTMTWSCTGETCS